MSKQARRRLGIGATLVIGTAVVVLWFAWPNAHRQAAEAQESTGTSSSSDRLAELQARFGQILGEDPALQPTDLDALAEDIQADLSAGTFEGEEIVRARQLLMTVLRTRGDQAGALGALGGYLDEVAAQKGPEKARLALRRLADDARAHRDWAGAIDLYSLLQQRWPGEAEAAYAAYRLAECLERQGNLADAIAAYQNTISSFPQGEWTGEAYLRCGWCCRQVRDFTTAATLYNELKTARPGTRYPAEAQRQLAEMYMLEDRNEEAIGAYEDLKPLVEPSVAEQIDAIIAGLSAELLEEQ